MSDHLSRLAAAVLLASFDGPAAPDWLLRRLDHGLGGVCLFGSNLTGDVAALCDRLHGARPELLVAIDEEGGDVTRLEAATGSSVPGNAALGAVDDPALTREVAAALGTLLAGTGIDLDLAPVADVNCDPANPVIGVRSFGEDPDLVARHVAAYVEGLQRAGVAACAKHFPGHGATRTDSHVALPVVDADVGLLRRRELVPFRAAIAAGAATVMTAHLRVPSLDARPATTSHQILVGLLRDELGFEGAVVTDALDMEGIGGPGHIPVAVVESLRAGADLCCLGPGATDDLLEASIGAITATVRAGGLAEERLAEAAHRVAAIRTTPTPGAPTARALADVGAEAARRALHVEGELPAPLDGAHVVELQRPLNIAAGDVPWGVGARLAEHLSDVTVERATDERDVASSVERAAGRPLVVVVRDAHRHPAQASAYDALLGARPDAVIVDLGWPDPSDHRGAARLTLYGASLASGDAAACVLAALEPSPRRTCG